MSIEKVGYKINKLKRVLLHVRIGIYFLAAIWIGFVKNAFSKDQIRRVDGIQQISDVLHLDHKYGVLLWMLRLMHQHFGGLVKVILS